jgi:hypothetical protein
MSDGVDFDVVREIALALPEVEGSTSYGAMSFKVRGTMFACRAVHRSAEPGSLMVRIEHSLRDELLATEPDVYYVTPHYEKHPCLLVRLGRIRREALERLLGISCLFVSSSSRSRIKKGKSKRKAKIESKSKTGSRG